MAEDGGDEDLRAMGATRTPARTLWLAALAGALIAVLLFAAARFAAERDRANETSHDAGP